MQAYRICFKFHSNTEFSPKNPFSFHYSRIATPWISKKLFLKFSFLRVLWDLSYKQFNRNLSICVSLAKNWFMLHKKFNQDLILIFSVKNWLMWNKNFVYVLNYLKFLRQCPKTIQGCTHLNKIKKRCRRQLPTSKSLLL